MNSRPFETLGFVRSSLVRHSAERGDGAMERHGADPGARTILVAGEQVIVRAENSFGTALLSNREAQRPADASRQERIFLGTSDGVPVFAALVATEAAEDFKADPAYKVVDLRSLALQGLVAPDELGVLATAKSLLAWHSRHRFCSNCGSPTEPSCAGFRRDCAACGAQHFPRTDPVVIMLVTRGDACLLGRQSRFVPGMYSCLAGFLEPGETVEDAVRRETFEEAGVRVGPVSYMASQPWPFPSSLMIGCRGEALDGELTVDRDELEDARWFTKDELRLMLAREHPDGLSAPFPIAIAHHLIRVFVEEG
jgi:NAD+ diphosphatase